MKKILLLSATLVFFVSNILFGQVKKTHLPPNPKADKIAPIEQLQPQISSEHFMIPLGARSVLQTPKSFYASQSFLKKNIIGKSLKVASVAENGLPICIKGSLKTEGNGNGLNDCFNYLSAAGEVMQIQQPAKEFKLISEEDDELGQRHFRFQQEFGGVKIYGAEVILHSQNGKISMLNGRYFPTPQFSNLTPDLDQATAIQIVKKDLATFEKVKDLNDFEKKLVAHPEPLVELVIFHPNEDLKTEVLTWHITIYPHVGNRYDYFINANNGAILQKNSNICRFTHLHSKGTGCVDHLKEMPGPVSTSEILVDGPKTANAVDLKGISRTINTYQVGSTYYMLDAARPMHNPSASSYPNDPNGVVWTLDARNRSPENTNFDVNQITSSNNAWSSRNSVSAHYNGGIAYEYFRTTFGRQSINDRNGSILSVVNVAESDGSGLDNAFWNGAGIFYGNGNALFNAPLAKGLDVAGHEMAHGVIETTANLEYMNESGALNESFADVFGSMIDRDDWTIGEEVANPSFFPSGAMRSMSNPHNGGSSLNDNGWQPRHYNERYIGNEDNGGVHINSGIPNHAFYLFATNPNVGNTKAEQVFYRALTKYLVRSSQYMDFRIAVVQAATDLHGANSAEVNAAKAALDAVGIPGGSGGDYQNDLPPNRGDQRLLLTDADLSAIYLSNRTGTLIGNPFIDIGILSRPSVTDDGSYAVFIAEDKTMYEINFVANTFRRIQSDPIWRNAVISKDGSKLAAITDDFDATLSVFDFNTQRWKDFELYNPTFSTGVQTGDVEYPDILEWDYSGEWVMYDALNKLNSTFGDIHYWDIGFINVWENGLNNFSDGFISKLFNGLPDDVTIGNPTFSKNSPYIIAFDFWDEALDEYEVLSMNLETGDISDPPLFENVDYGYPNFAPDDKDITFDAQSQSGELVLAILPLSTDKLTTAGQARIFFDGGSWGVWYANGSRPLSTKDGFQDLDVKVFPNPVTDVFSIEIPTESSADFELEILDLMGTSLLKNEIKGGKSNLDWSSHPAGTYFLKISQSGAPLFSQRLMKF